LQNMWFWHLCALVATPEKSFLLFAQVVAPCSQPAYTSY